MLWRITYSLPRYLQRETSLIPQVVANPQHGRLHEKYARLSSVTRTFFSEMSQHAIGDRVVAGADPEITRDIIIVPVHKLTTSNGFDASVIDPVIGELMYSG